MWTDFPDYVPGATVFISGSGFHADEPVVLQVLHLSGNNSGAGHAPFTVTADSDGEFGATWLVDPDDSYGETFILTADCLHGLHAQTTFTDNIHVDFRQAANNDPTNNCLPAGPVLGNVHWLNSILQQNNSTYIEGMVVPQRLVMSEVPATANDVHTLVFWHDALKNGHHAYDFLASWPQAVSTANSISPGSGLMYNLFNNQCGCELGPPSGGAGGLDTICANLHSGLGFTAFADCPDAMGSVGGDDVAARVTAFETAFSNRQVKIYGNAAFTGTPTLTFTGYTGSNPMANYTLTWTSASTQIIVEFGGHLAITGPASNPLAYQFGAGTIMGAPYHFSLGHIDTTSLGNEDNQIKCEEIVPSCILTGPVEVACGSTSTYTVTVATGVSFDATFTILNNTAGAAFVGSSSCNNVTSCSTMISVAHCGSFTLRVSVDVNGGTVVCDQPVTVTDGTPPVITCPPDANVPCGGSTDPENTGIATATDACGPVQIGYTDASGPVTCAGTGIIRTWTATDGCGNTSSCMQTITIVDTTAPSITCPDPVNVQCIANVPPPDPNSVTATDNCGGPVQKAFVGDQSAGTCPTIITRTYSAMDACGNTATCTQTITVGDTIPPVITCPPDFTLPCGTSTSPLVTGFASAADNCNPDLPVSFSDGPLQGSCPQGASFIRTWSATDGCNTVTCQQLITLSAGPGSGCVPASVVDLGGGCGAPAPILTSSPPILGNYLAFRILNAAPNAQIIFAVDTPPFPPPLPLGGGCILYVDPAQSLILDFWYTDLGGDWTNRTLIAANLPQLIGVQLIAQAGILSQGGPLGFAQLTNALLLTFGSCPPFCTASKDGYAGNGFPGQVFDINYATVFPTGLDIGVFDLVGGAAPPNGLRWDATPAGRTALKTFLGGAGGPSGPLTSDNVNPVTTFGGGSLALQAATLALNIGFNNAGVLGSGLPGFASQVYYNYPGVPDSLNGLNVTQILGVANQALAGNGLPSGYSFDSLATLVENINLAYDGCNESFWGSKYLFAPVN